MDLMSQKLKMKSHDVIGTNTQKISLLFPSCVTERLGKNGKSELVIDFEKLQAELRNDIIIEGEERYQFTWPDKRKAVREANVQTTSTLRPCRDESVNFDNTQNLYIEGLWPFSTAPEPSGVCELGTICL